MLLTFAVAAVMLAGTIAFTITPVSAEMGPQTGPVPERPSSDRLATTSSLPDTGESTSVDGSTASTTANLNLRRSPSLSAAIQTVIPVGSVVEINGEAEDGFYPVKYGSVTGFAHGDYLAIGDEATDSAGSTTDTTADTGAGSGGSDIVQIIYNAAAMYGQNGDDLLRVATCESGLNPYAVNGSSNASGLFQFLPSTWATTPYAGQDIFDPVANAEAAAWMWANGRRGEWSCQ
jgi:3D (Asp-Asp-Asp) domain-containing protein